jgi:hypothetical protein
MARNNWAAGRNTYNYNKALDQCGAHSSCGTCWCCQITLSGSNGIANASSGNVVHETCDKLKTQGSWMAGEVFAHYELTW